MRVKDKRLDETVEFEDVRIGEVFCGIKGTVFIKTEEDTAFNVSSNYLQVMCRTDEVTKRKATLVLE